MARYRKKPVEVEAIQWKENNLEEITNFMGYEPIIITGYSTSRKFINIHTLEGDMACSPDDYIIKGITGEFYPCKPNIFWKTYEVIE